MALHASHLATFGHLLPPQFDACNQGGDPFLFELHRRFGLAGLCEDMRISNGIGEGAGLPSCLLFCWAPCTACPNSA